MSGLGRLLDPASIAIAGLSADPAKHGGRVLANLRKLGYRGEVWGVNPKLPRVEGIEVQASLGDLREPPDLVVCAVPAPVVRDIAIAARGVGALIVFAGGFAESGEDGMALEADLSECVDRVGFRLLGPNSGGVIRPSVGLAASFLTCLDRPAEQIRTGPVGLVTQSGGTGSYIHNLAAERGSGLAVSVSTGNEVDIRMGEALSNGGRRVAAFVEKPDFATAQLYLASGGYVWNGGIFVFKAAFEAIPRSLLDAARIDGVPEWMIVFRIVMPLTKPAIATNVILSFIWSWNSFLWPLVIVRDTAMQTLPLGLSRFLSVVEDTTGALYAFCVMVLVPGLVIFLLAQKEFVSGLTSGATKG